MTMLETVASYIEQHQLLPDRGTVVVAVSGGADSLCLLHILHRLCGPGKRYGDVRLHVAHLNHRLRGAESERDAVYVEQVARAWGLPVTIGEEDVRALAQIERLSLEEAARIARYDFLREVAREGVWGGGCIATAHHADDQVETLLLHLLRGGGLASMVGMPPRRGDIIRPLLAVSRSDILAYCREHDIVALEDSSNTDPHYLRNRVRHELLPLLESMNPGIHATLLRNADIARVDDEYIESQLDAHWISVVGTEVSSPHPVNQTIGPGGIGQGGRDTSVPTGVEQDNGFTIHIPALLALPLSLRRRLLRRVTADLCGGQSPLEPRHYALVEQFLYNTNNGEERSLDLPGHLRLSRIFDTCQVFVVYEYIPPVVAATQESVELTIPGRVAVSGTQWLATAEEVADGVTQAVRQAIERGDWARVWQLLSVDKYTVYIDGDTITTSLMVRTRRAGDRIRPLGMKHEKKVQDVLVDARVPRSERTTIPLLFSEGQCIWLASLCLADSVKLTATTRRIVRLKIISTHENIILRETMHEDISEILITKEEILNRVAELGEQITRDYRGKNVLLLGTLKGAVPFIADLARAILLPLEIDYMAISSYGNSTQSSGVVRILKDLEGPIDQKHVLIVEDIIDSGMTLHYLMEVLRQRRPLSLRVCTLLDKGRERVKSVKLDYMGFQIPDRFVVGYGLDYAQRYRNLPYIGILKPSIYEDTESAERPQTEHRSPAETEA